MCFCSQTYYHLILFFKRENLPRSFDLPSTSILLLSQKNALHSLKSWVPASPSGSLLLLCVHPESLLHLPQSYPLLLFPSALNHAGDVHPRGQARHLGTTLRHTPFLLHPHPLSQQRLNTHGQTHCSPFPILDRGSRALVPMPWLPAALYTCTHVRVFHSLCIYYCIQEYNMKHM